MSDGWGNRDATDRLFIKLGREIVLGDYYRIDGQSGLFRVHPIEPVPGIDADHLAIRVSNARNRHERRAWMKANGK